jgi:hypothetical protein
VRAAAPLALAGLLALAGASAGCGGAFGSAKSDFRKGRVAEAKEELVKLEPEARAWPNARRAEYALYRGLVHHSLGDRAAARPWLAQAKALDDAHPNALSADDRVRLGLALESLASEAATSSP